jgi:hypothetical protein
MAAPLPYPVLEFCSRQMIGDTLATAFELLTVDEDGWPLVAHLSVGEILVDTDGAMRIALWPGTRSNAALQSTRLATLIFVCDGSIYEVRCRCAAVRQLVGEARLDAFLLVPVDVRDKSAPYAKVVSGVTYAYKKPGEARGHWKVLQDQLSLCF